MPPPLFQGKGEIRLECIMANEDKNRVYVRQLLSPQNVNLHGSVFGGDLYSLFDCAAYIASKEVYPDYEFVTRSTESAFLAPLYPGDAYYTLRPGITGLWQVSERNATAFADRAHYDTRYEQSLSLVTDLRILMATIRVVLRGTGY